MRACIVLACSLLPFGSALACGHCIEDKIAAVYDHASIARAYTQKHAVVYLGFDSAVALNQVVATEIKTQAQKIRGVDPDSVRVSLESGSLAVSFDPQRISYMRLIQTLEKQLAAKKITFFVLDSISVK